MYLYTEFDFISIPFVLADCLEDEFRCDNNRCIDNRLECDDYDNCGDGSDHNCHLPVYVVASIAVVSIVVLLAGLFLIVVWRYRCRQKRFESEESNNEVGLTVGDCAFRFSSPLDNNNNNNNNNN